MQTTQELTQSAMVFFQYRGAYVWKNPTGRARSMDGNRIITFGHEGSADIIGTLACGKSAYIEIKAGKDRMSPEQIKFAKEMIARGAFHVVVKYIDDMVSGWRAHCEACEVCNDFFKTK